MRMVGSLVTNTQVVLRSLVQVGSVLTSLFKTLQISHVKVKLDFYFYLFVFFLLPALFSSILMTMCHSAASVQLKTWM